MKKAKFDGPIPGENYTSNTKNYPWHRAPQEADFVAIVEKALKNLQEPRRMGLVLSALESGETILDLVTGITRVAVGNGRIPIDAGVLAAGPIAKAIETIAINAEIEFERGWEQKPRIPTGARAKAILGRGERELPETIPEPEEKPAPKGGFMAGPSPDNGPAAKDDQAAMLGYTEGDE